MLGTAFAMVSKPRLLLSQWQSRVKPCISVARAWVDVGGLRLTFLPALVQLWVSYLASVVDVASVWCRDVCMGIFCCGCGLGCGSAECRL